MYHHSCSVIGSLDVLGMSGPPRSASHPCLKAYAVSYSLAAALLLKISSICQLVNPAAWCSQYTLLPSGFMVIPILHGMGFSTSSYCQADGDCGLCCYEKTEQGWHVYMCSAEPGKSYDNPPTHSFDRRPVSALQFHYHYIASEGSVNTLYGAASRFPASGSTVLRKMKDRACHESGVMSAGQCQTESVARTEAWSPLPADHYRVQRARREFIRG
jgi:hypothetical protein